MSELPDFKALNERFADPTAPVPTEDFSDLKMGDTVTRMLAGTIPVVCTVEKIEDGIIFMVGGWTFDQATGVEEDEDLGWGVRFGYTGSYLVRE